MLSKAIRTDSIASVSLYIVGIWLKFCPLKKKLKPVQDEVLFLYDLQCKNQNNTQDP